jgi:TolB-like protein
MGLVSELRRRNVFRVAIAYLLMAWIVLEVGDVLAPALHLPDWVVSALVFFLVLGFPLALIFAWAFELTPEGLKLEKNVDRSHSITHLTGRRLDYLIIGVLILALLVFAFDEWVLEPSTETTAVTSPSANTVAVLAFADMSPEGDQEYFSDGVAEEILNVLAKVPGLQVISRSSSFSLKNKDLDIPTAAKQLGVAHILEGSVRKSGNRIRITAQLIDARTDMHLWSEAYDRSLDDVFAVQDEIALAVRDALKEELALDKGDATPKIVRAATISAYEAYLRGRQLIHLRGRSNLDSAVEYLEHSLRLDSDFAPAHAQLAIATTLLMAGSGSYGDLSLEEVRRTAIPHLERALNLEPELAEAHAGFQLLSMNSGDLPAAIEYGRQALQLNPNYGDALLWLYISLEQLGEYLDANGALQRLQVIDPMSLSARVNYANWLGNVGQIEEARKVADQLLSISPLASYLRHAVLSMSHEGKIAEGVSWALKAYAEDPGNLPSRSSLAWPFLILGEYDEARRIDVYFSDWADFAEGKVSKAIQATQEKLLQDPSNETAVAEAAGVLLFAGRVQEALPLFERLRDFHPPGRPIGLYPFQAETTIRLAYARRQSGDDAGALAAAQIVRDDLAAREMAGQNNIIKERASALLAAFENDTERAIAAIESALDKGLTAPFFFDDPIFEDLRHEPRFVALQQRLDRLLEVEHEKVLQLICLDNPVPDSWQPLPETCDDITAQRVH